ncbi:MAG: Glycosyl transferase family 2 [Candidatus Magasanikbacteria bacterium GW2011_GWC2_37_14]|uniref:Glycosyl transferase family 2 n=1 Tax=Candidatus Magasanikbacteria bacterium GW2011_GWC2_37_14 TaxID=1619046 RepID=A0A0G0GBE9_9BACT|nr:MAG: Glycosyl transferase family 2 [Candidatus Magasanikbacteria bacterium GW2011_GWC2_37_14]
MDLSVITVTWNSEDFIEKQIKSVVLGCKNIEFEQIVVDNASKDKTTEFVEKYPSVVLIKSLENLGFGAGNNQGAKISNGEFLLFLNADNQVAEGSLDKMVEWMRNNPKVGLASCKLLDQFGKFNEDAKPRRFPKVWEMVALIFKIPHLMPQILDNYYMKDFDPEKEQEVPSVRGSFMIVRRDVYEKLGWAFDPRYFIWFEDVDTCREVWQAGYKVMYTPIISCIDFVGQSFKKRATYWKQKNFTKSMLQYFQKWEPMHKWIWIWLTRPFGLVLAWLNDKL